MQVLLFDHKVETLLLTTDSLHEKKKHNIPLSLLKIIIFLGEREMCKQ